MDNVVAPVNGVMVPQGDDNLKVPLVRVRKLVGLTANVFVLISRILELLVPMFMVIRLKKVVAPEPEISWFPSRFKVRLQIRFAVADKFSVPLLTMLPVTVI